MDHPMSPHSRTIALNGWDPDANKATYAPLDLHALGEQLVSARSFIPSLGGGNLEVRRATFAPMGGISAESLSEAGWGIIYAPNLDPRVITALEPLLSWRRSQLISTGTIREFRGDTGYLPGASGAHFGSAEVESFLARNRMGPGPVDPERVPYYLLIVGSPQQIPWDFQFSLDRQYAAGRLWFDTAEQFEVYARGVVAAESKAPRMPPSASILATAEPNDPITDSSLKHLATPLADRLTKTYGDAVRIERRFRNAATLEATIAALRRPDRAPVWFTCTHGVALPRADLPKRRAYEGSLVLQQDPRSQPSSSALKNCLTASDITSEADLTGLIAFLFGCSTAGSDSFDWNTKLNSTPTREPFVASLARRLLSNPGGPALAVVGHVGPVSECSFLPNHDVSGLNVFFGFMRQILQGRPAGMALEDLNSRHAELGDSFGQHLNQARAGNSFARSSLGIEWLRYLDARGYCLLGDPAVRIVTSRG